MTKLNITQKELKESLSYDEETGLFKRVNSVGKFKEGSVAGCLDNSTGYIRIRLCDKVFVAHRLAWLYVHGEMPVEEIDHINHVRSDNRICNLRPVNSQGNSRNATISVKNTSGVTGVSWRKDRSKWVSYIVVNRKKLNLGCFSCLKEATKVRKEAEVKYGFHENHGV